MTDKLINIGEFNEAVRRRLGETDEVISLIERIEPKQKALYINVTDRAHPQFPSKRALFAYASTLRIHSLTAKNPDSRTVLHEVIDHLKDHSEKVTRREVKPYRP